MRNPDDRDRLAAALGELPRHRASAGFTERTIAQLDRADGARPQPAPPIAWAALVLVLVVVGLLVSSGVQRQRSADQAYRRQVEELESRYQDLLEEVTLVRRQVAAPDTRIYLGGDDRLDLVLDLTRPDPDPTRAVEPGVVQPASLNQ